MSSQESGDGDSEPELLPEAAMVTLDASRKRLTNDNTSSATSKKCKRAIDRAWRNVQQAFASFHEESDIEYGAGSSSDDAGEKDSTVGTSRCQTKNPRTTPSTKRLTESQGPKASKITKEGKRLQETSTATNYVDTTPRQRQRQNKRADKLKTTPAGRPTIDISPLSSPRGDNFQHDTSRAHSSPARSPSPMLDDTDSVRSALKNITTLLNNVVQRIDRVEDQLRQQNSCTPSSSSSEQKSTRKKSPIPLLLRVSFCNLLP